MNKIYFVYAQIVLIIYLTLASILGRFDSELAKASDLWMNLYLSIFLRLICVVIVVVLMFFVISRELKASGLTKLSEVDNEVARAILLWVIDKKEIFYGASQVGQSSSHIEFLLFGMFCKPCALILVGDKVFVHNDYLEPYDSIIHNSRPINLDNPNSMGELADTLRAIKRHRR